MPRDPLQQDDGPAWEELHVAGPDGATRPFVTGEVNVGDVAWTPDGTGIAFLAKRDGDDEPCLYLIALAGGEARRLLCHATAITAFSFSPDGGQVAFVAAEEEPKEQKELDEQGLRRRGLRGAVAARPAVGGPARRR